MRWQSGRRLGGGKRAGLIYILSGSFFFLLFFFLFYFPLCFLPVFNPFPYLLSRVDACQYLGRGKGGDQAFPRLHVKVARLRVGFEVRGESLGSRQEMLNSIASRVDKRFAPAAKTVVGCR